MWNATAYDCECNKASKINEYLDIKNCSCKKLLVGKLVLACGIKYNRSLLVGKKVTPKKSGCLVYTFSWVIICLLLIAVISGSCYYYHTKYWIKKEY